MEFPWSWSNGLLMGMPVKVGKLKSIVPCPDILKGFRWNHDDESQWIGVITAWLFFPVSYYVMHITKTVWHNVNTDAPK